MRMYSAVLLVSQAFVALLLCLGFLVRLVARSGARTKAGSCQWFCGFRPCCADGVAGCCALDLSACRVAGQVYAHFTASLLVQLTVCYSFADTFALRLLIDSRLVLDVAWRRRATEQ